MLYLVAIAIEVRLDRSRLSPFTSVCKAAIWCTKAGRARRSRTIASWAYSCFAARWCRGSSATSKALVQKPTIVGLADSGTSEAWSAGSGHTVRRRDRGHRQISCIDNIVVAQGPPCSIVDCHCDLSPIVSQCARIVLAPLFPKPSIGIVPCVIVCVIWSSLIGLSI